MTHERSRPEWIGKNGDADPPDRVKLRIFEAHGGACATCKRKLYPGDRIEYDHVRPLWQGGENRESNLQPLCGGCHQPKTVAEAKQRAKSLRIRKAQAGIRRKGRKMPYRKFNGDIVWPE